MTIDAAEVVSSIGKGVAEALATSTSFLGVDIDAYRNADIHPEYVTTVEVAKRLTGPDRRVDLEAHMKELRWEARRLAWMARGGKRSALAGVDNALAPFRFGRKDSRRLDIMVRQADDMRPPLLMVEAKLGVRNRIGVIQDIDRLVQLFDMHHAVGLLTEHQIYGAAVFHSMEEGNASGIAGAPAQSMLRDVDAHLISVTSTRPWLKARSGLLSIGTKIQPVTGYTEHHEDGSAEDVFGKDCFHFAPGMALLGNASDVNSVRF